MPERIILFTKFIYSDYTCLTTYLISGIVGSFFTSFALQLISTLVTLAISSILVFYLKKWLERKDTKLNKDGGLVDFVKVYLKTKYKDKCKDKCE